MNLLAAVAGVITGASMVYCALCIWAAVHFLLQADRLPVAPPTLLPVSILKPLKGTDPEMYESFRSHCLQDYGEYEILFGVTDVNDPAAALVKTLQHEFPTRDIRLVLCGKRLGMNGKVSALAQLAELAKYDFFVVNDSDIRVTPDYLQTLCASLHAPKIGLVTCLYRGVAARKLASRIEALTISTDFAPGVLVAKMVERGLHFGLGSTLALRRETLKRIGGFGAIADYLADDYELGKRVADDGLDVQLSTLVVETFLAAYSFSEFWLHQLRWARTVRISRPGGYVGLLITYTLPWAVVCLVLARGEAWAWILFGAAAGLRLVSALVSGVSVLRDREVVRSLWLLPFRDILAPVIWFAGLFGRKIAWRGENFYLEKGKLRRVS